MKLLLPLLLLVSVSSFGQKALKLINEKETERIERVLSADEMKGRKTFSPEIEKAAAFIANEFEKNGLQKWNGSNSFLQEFSMIGRKLISKTGKVNNAEVEGKNIIAISPKATLEITERSGYEKLVFDKDKNLMQSIRKIISAEKNTIVFADTSNAKVFARLSQMGGAIFSNHADILLVMTNEVPSTFEFNVKQEISKQPLANVVGVIPGKSKPNEYVIFSGHYDHIGINSKNMINNDSIYNGANDDAAGTTAVIMLSKYYKELNDNERTLIFATFTAEEVGGFGAQYFSQQFNPDQVVAMFNIEMIGTESKWGKNSAYITGYEKTDMGALLQKTLDGTGFNFYPDPYPDQNLFYRSDNATLARLGVPAHTISTSKMDSEPNYHKASDEIGTLDMSNMTAIIRAIALSAKGIVDGKDTPTRVDTSSLR
jgi:Zn-dependent M28 family amino/carboxypeptidase